MRETPEEILSVLTAAIELVKQEEIFAIGEELDQLGLTKEVLESAERWIARESSCSKKYWIAIRTDEGLKTISGPYNDIVSFRRFGGGVARSFSNSEVRDLFAIEARPIVFDISTNNESETPVPFL